MYVCMYIDKMCLLWECASVCVFSLTFMYVCYVCVVVSVSVSECVCARVRLYCVFCTTNNAQCTRTKHIDDQRRRDNPVSKNRRACRHQETRGNLCRWVPRLRTARETRALPHLHDMTTGSLHPLEARRAPTLRTCVAACPHSCK